MSNNDSRDRLSLSAAAVSGVLAVAAALGFSHLAAGLLDPPSSPFLAVGNSAIDRTPPFLKNFAIEQFGSNDKNVLLLSMAVVMLLVGAVAGVLSRRSVVPGAVLIVALGVVGGLAVANRPNTEAYGPVTAVVAVVVGLAVLVLMRRLAPRPTVSRPVRDTTSQGVPA